METKPLKRILALSVLIALAGCASTPPKELPLTHAEAKAQETREFAAAMTSAKDAETQRLLVFAWAIRGNGNGNNQPVVQHGGATFWDFANETRRDLVSVLPAGLAYLGGKKAGDVTVRVSEINSAASMRQSDNFLALGVAGISGTASIGSAWANRPQPSNTPTTQVTVSGNSGPVNLGNGIQLNSSNNPTTNPNPVVCSTNQTGATTCSR